jgi:hypothetical protein
MKMMPTTRLLVPQTETAWPAAHDSDYQVVSTVYRAYIRQRGKFKPCSPLVRMTWEDASGNVLIELSEVEVRSARLLLARASVETANYLNSDDRAALAVVPEPQFLPACLEFSRGKLTVSVIFLASDIPSAGRRRIRLSKGHGNVELPNFECLA